jgi:hypothetical protein
LTPEHSDVDVWRNPSDPAHRGAKSELPRVEDFHIDEARDEACASTFFIERLYVLA